MCNKTLSEVLTQLDRAEPPISDIDPDPGVMAPLRFGYELDPDSLKRRGLKRQQQRSKNK